MASLTPLEFYVLLAVAGEHDTPYAIAGDVARTSLGAIARDEDAIAAITARMRCKGWLRPHLTDKNRCVLTPRGRGALIDDALSLMVLVRGAAAKRLLHQNSASDIPAR